MSLRYSSSELDDSYSYLNSLVKSMKKSGKFQRSDHGFVGSICIPAIIEITQSTFEQASLLAEKLLDFDFIVPLKQRSQDNVFQDKPNVRYNFSIHAMTKKKLPLVDSGQIDNITVYKKLKTSPLEIALQTRKYRGRVYKDCFLGKNVVDFLYQRYQISRNMAIKVGCSLLENNFICHATDTRGFEDKPYFYEFKKHKYYPPDFEPRIHLQEHLLLEKGKKNIDYPKIAKELFNAKSGVLVKSRRWKLMNYKNCFVGRYAVDWLVTKYKITRFEAIKIGDTLLELKYFECCHDAEEMPFLDKYIYYRPDLSLLIGEETAETLGSSERRLAYEEYFKFNDQHDSESVLSDDEDESNEPEFDWSLESSSGEKTSIFTEGDDSTEPLPPISPDSKKRTHDRSGNFSASVDESKKDYNTPDYSSEERTLKNGKRKIIKHYKLGKKLGSGAFSIVYEAKSVIDNKKYAVKKIELNDGPNLELQKEVEIMQRVSKHKNILKLYDYFVQDNCYYLVLQRATKGELFEHIIERGEFSEQDTRNVAVQLFSGLNHLHEAGIAHRDLKPQNLLITKKSTLLIADFGLSKHFANESLVTRCGSLEYIAPELLYSGSYTQACDLWAAGVILYICLTGFFPFSGTNQTLLFKNIKKCHYVWPLEKNGKELEFSNEVKIFVSKLLDVNPESRLTAKEALNDNWILQEFKKSESFVNITSLKQIVADENNGEWNSSPE